MNHKRYALLACTLITLLVIPALRAAEPPKDAKEAKPSAIPEPDGEKMEKLMKDIDVVYKKLPRRVKNKEKNAESLQLLGEMQQLTISAKSLPPSNIENKPEADRLKYYADYRLMMIELLKQEIAAEEAILKGNNPEAARIVEDLHKVENDGHKQFQDEKDKEEKKAAPK